MSTAATSLRFWRRVRRRVVWAAFALAAIACAAVAYAIVLSNRPPAWWADIDPHDSRQVILAEDLENAVGTHLHLARETDPSLGEGERWRSEPWRVAMRSDDANAWLNTRLEAWLESLSNGAASIPDEVRHVRVVFDRGRIRVGALIDDGRTRRVLSATLRPELRADGSLWVSAESVGIGRLSLPPDWTLGSDGPPDARVVPASLWNKPAARDLVEAVRGRRPLLDEPVIELLDGRSVRLLSIAARDGRLEVECRTEGGGR
ncbi:MAG: hypothetical protein KIS87_08425 [Phycisphaeraceae bacterium]|nr:hypothetical protein [Phycisphaeraceae bacterium]